ncbi:ATP-binding cassette domain-containing protein [Frankia sp. QA3]|uniref:ATP-binding cassette domain-containing protein n=1 Tax=Frankia sp. QA3 TaxID=710111 RepID=UPI000269BB1A|nr:ATP-binding cassette domain-containing protein [Frankia sp. QA3]EIV91188.1 hypothetical protein FraQA3DRAFT_0622 [Frankia sp. QA3]
MLRCAGVALVREDRELLADVDLTVRPGEHWALLGANGAGKSSLLGLCGAVHHPTRGSVDVLGHRLGRVDVRVLRGWLGHLEDLPVTTTHAMLLRGGRALATGRADDVLTTELVSACFDHPISVRREDGRWSARAPRRTG